VFRVVSGAVLGAATGLAVASLVFVVRAKAATSGADPVHEHAWPTGLSLLLIAAGAVAGASYARRAAEPSER
jgi:hypothetical protein